MLHVVLYAQIMETKFPFLLDKFSAIHFLNIFLNQN